jgi:hypothetical protein
MAAAAINQECKIPLVHFIKSAVAFQATHTLYHHNKREKLKNINTIFGFTKSEYVRMWGNKGRVLYLGGRVKRSFNI